MSLSVVGSVVVAGLGRSHELVVPLQKTQGYFLLLVGDTSSIAPAPPVVRVSRLEVGKPVQLMRGNGWIWIWGSMFCGRA